MVQIDDAGSGSLVGACIGLYYDKTNSFKFDFIPWHFTLLKNTKKLYQQYVIDIVKKFFDDFYSKDEPIKYVKAISLMTSGSILNRKTKLDKYKNRRPTSR